MNEELKILKLVVDRLDQAGVMYFISGSMAANYYSVPRMTRDIDIVLELRRSQLKSFMESFRGDFYLDEGSIGEEVDRGGTFNLIHKEHALKVDCIIRKETEFQNSCFRRRREIRLEGFDAWIISLEDLILAKLLWAKDSVSELQLRDVRNLLRTAGNPDAGYLQEWIDKLSLRELYEKVEA